MQFILVKFLKYVDLLNLMALKQLALFSFIT